MRRPALIACLAVPHFALRVAALDRPRLDGEPLVLIDASGAAPVVADRTPEAAERGIRIGMGVREAFALCHDATVLQPNPVRERGLADRLLGRLERLSPLVEADAALPGHWYVDLLGLDRHLGPSTEAATRLLATLPPALRPRAGVGPGKFVARVASGQAAPGGTRVVPAAEARSFLADRAVTWLPLPPKTIQRLETLGLHTLGALAALPRATVAAQFGPAGAHAWDLANGHDDEPVRPRSWVPVVSEHLDLPASVTTRETLLLATEWLVKRAFRRPVLQGRHVRRARLRLHLDGGRSWATSLTLREPSGEADLGRALRLRLAAIAPPGPVASLAIDLTGLTAELGKQQRLPTMTARRPASLIEAARHLKARYGASPLFRVVAVEPWSRLPEERHALMRYDP